MEAKSNDDNVSVGDDVVSIAMDLRQRGNHEFTNGRCDEAVAFYTAALQHCVCSNTTTSGTDTKVDVNQQQQQQVVRDERILNLCNRSACYSQQEEYELGIQDAIEAWELSQYKSVKAAYRYAKCAMYMKDYNTAKTIIQSALRVLDDDELQMSIASSSTSSSSQQQQPSETTESPVNKDASTTTPTTTTTQPLDTSKQRTALKELWNQILSLTLKSSTDTTVEKPETTIKFVKRPISIKEFILQKQLGHGNFSEIYMVQHKVTKELYALKKIEKKQAAELFKRQHPNVYNEIQMERRVLLERLASSTPSPYIVQMYHAFQDYNSLYYLMDLHVERTDLWSQLRYIHLPGYTNTSATSGTSKVVMMGCHRSTAKLWLYELISALEFIHSRGIVHRDLKTENILLSSTGHVIVIDFGTAKDLIQTDLNGPEFVGTPDFMSPEAVTGTDNKTKSGNTTIKQDALLSDKDLEKTVEAGPEADLWALGAIAFILQTGHTPYWSPSPYLAFLKIKRSLQFPNLLRPMGIIDDDCWDIIVQLMRGNPMERIGAGTYTIDTEKKGIMRCTTPNGYDCIRQHPYFNSVHTELTASNTNGDLSVRNKSIPIPSLLDLCYRACAEMAYQNSKNVQFCDQYKPGDQSKYDLTRLDAHDRAAVLHCLDRRRLLSEPRVYGRFFTDSVQARLDTIRTSSRDVIGLTQMNDDQGKPPKAMMHDQYAKPIEMDPITIVVLTCPPYDDPDAMHTDDDNDNNDLQQQKHKNWIKLLKKGIININRSRPNLVVIIGHVDDASRKILSKISETIPLVVHDGTSYFTFWRMGVQCIALTNNISNKTNTTTLSDDQQQQMLWLKQHLEQVRLSKYPLFVFVATDPNTISEFVMKKLAQGRTLCIFGVSSKLDTAPNSKSNTHEEKVIYQANEVVDDVTVRSTDSEEDEKDGFTTKIKCTSSVGIYRITLDDEPDLWDCHFEAMSL